MENLGIVFKKVKGFNIKLFSIVIMILENNLIKGIEVLLLTFCFLIYIYILKT